MQKLPDDLTLYDRTRRRLREALAGQLPGNVDLGDILTSYAYWVCTSVSKRGVDWETTLRDYIDVARRRAADESAAERRKAALLRRELTRACGPVLEVGAGWSRLAWLYDELGLRAVYVEPVTLGTQLMRHDGPDLIVCCMGRHCRSPMARSQPPSSVGCFTTTHLTWMRLASSPRQRV